MDQILAAGEGAHAAPPEPDAGIHARLREPMQYQAKEDFNEFAEQAARTARKGLCATLDAILSRPRIRVIFDALEPMIDLKSLRDWLRLTRRIDPDTLLCYLIAKEGPFDGIGRHHALLDAEGVVRSFTDWGLVTRIAARDLDVICRRPLSDLHVHLGGLRSPQLFWIELMSGASEPKGIRFFSDRALHLRHDDGRKRGDLKADIDLIAACRDVPDRSASRQGRELLAPLKLEQFPVKSSADPETLTHRVELLASERIFLIRSFRKLIALEGEDHRDAAALRRAMRFYISVKSCFICGAQQPIDDKIGLGFFRESFGALLPERRLGPPGNVSLPAARKTILDALFCVSASLRRLQRLELRFAPLDSAHDYRAAMAAWEGLLQANQASVGSLAIRYAVHFKRSLDLKKPRRDGKGERALDEKDNTLVDAIEHFHKGLDQDTANFHRYRVEAARLGGDELRRLRRIVRIDFAGQERDLSLSRAAFELRLLRSDGEAQQALKELHRLSRSPGKKLSYQNAMIKRHRGWIALQEEGRADQRILAAPLGITCHAGEDFAQPVEGLFAIASAMDVLRLAAGDTIGHGLALGVDPEQERRRRRNHTLTRRGRQFDALVWLWSFLSEHVPNVAPHTLRKLELHLWRAYPDIYGKKVSVSNLQDFQDLNETRWLPCQPATPKWPAHFQELWRHDKSRKVQRKRLDRVSITPIMRELEEVIRLAQAKLLQQLSERGIALEFNPSSNWRVVGAINPRDLPYIPILKARGPAITATLATDNPGVYGTRIENEYAIVFDGLTASDVTREEALEILERLRLVGAETVYWPMAEDRSGGSDDAAPLHG